jgi:hypothetical protein
MRPTHPLDRHDNRSRKSSITDHNPANRQHAGPTTFFLARGADSLRSSPDTDRRSESSADASGSLQESLEEAGRRSKQITPRSQEPQHRPSSRRRSTIKPSSAERLHRRSSAVEPDPPPETDRASTPSPLPSHNVSLPSSPKSISSRSLQKSDEDMNSDDAGSQAIASSEEEEEPAPPAIQDSQPELIMPSIKMPSRRPFTPRGKRLGRFKILVAGQKGETVVKYDTMLLTFLRIRQDVSNQVYCPSLRRHCPCRSLITKLNNSSPYIFTPSPSRNSHHRDLC